MKFFVQMFSESGGKPSSTRALVAVVILTVMGVWGCTCIRTKTFQPLDAGSVALVIGTLTSRAFQRGKEGEISVTPVPEPPAK